MNGNDQERLSVLDIIARVFDDEGVDIVFGHSGTILPARDAVLCFSDIYRELSGRPDGRAASAQDEAAGFNATGLMAAAYARASGKVAVMVRSGQGAAGALAGVGGDPAPIVLLCCRCPLAAGHQLPHWAKRVFVVTGPAGLEAALPAAFAVARSGRPGPVLVDISRDVRRPL